MMAGGKQRRWKCLALIVSFHVMQVHASLKFPPVLGSKKLLALPIDFPDAQATISSDQWLPVLDGEGGMSDFFLEESYQQLTLSSSVANYVRLGDKVSNYEGYEGCGKAVREALEKLNEQEFDFTPYASGNVLDGLVIFAEMNNHNHDGHSVRSHAWSLSPPLLLSGGVVAYRYCWIMKSAGLGMTALAVLAHELGHHVLHLRDYYDYSSGGDDFDNPHGTEGSALVGLFSLMGAGALTNQYPAHCSPWEKFKLGWITPVEVAESAFEVGYRLRPAQDFPDALLLKISGTDEVFFVENRQEIVYRWQDVKDGDYYKEFCPGILIWHVDTKLMSEDWAPNDLKEDNVHPGITIEEADGDASLRGEFKSKSFVECGDTWKLGEQWAGHAASMWDGSDSGARVRVGDFEVDGTMTVYIVCPRCEATLARSPSGTTPEATLEPAQKTAPGPTPQPTEEPIPEPALEPTLEPTLAEPTLSYTGGWSTVSFVKRSLVDGVECWTDRSYTYEQVHSSGIPWGIEFWAGPHKSYSGVGSDGAFTFTTSTTGHLFFWSEDSSRHGGFPSAYAEDIVGTLHWTLGSCSVYQVTVSAGQTVHFPITTDQFVGGFAWEVIASPERRLAPGSAIYV